MIDEYGFVAKCKHSRWQVVDDEWNCDFICQTRHRGYCCVGDEDCKGYEPEGEEDDE